MWATVRLTGQPRGDWQANANTSLSITILAEIITK